MGAAEILVEVATRFWRAMGYALPRLPQNLQAALGWRVEDADMRWALALMLAGWRLTDLRESRANDVSQLLRQMGASWVVGQMNALRSIDGMEQFVDRARDADTEAKLKAAAVSLVMGIERLDALRLVALIETLRRSELREVGQQLIRRFPSPDSQRQPVYGSPPAPNKPQSRGAMFDRADYGPRDRALFRPTETVPMKPNRADEVERAIPSPLLDEQAMTAAYLHTLGYSDEQVQRLILGPDKKVT